MNERRIQDLSRKIKDVPRLSHEVTVGEAVLVLSGQVEQGAPPFALVVDQVRGLEEIIGSISFDDVLAEMERRATISGEVPIFWRGQFWEEAGRLFKKPVSEIMSPVKHASTSPAL